MGQPWGGLGREKQICVDSSTVPSNKGDQWPWRYQSNCCWRSFSERAQAVCDRSISNLGHPASVDGLPIGFYCSWTCRYALQQRRSTAASWQVWQTAPHSAHKTRGWESRGFENSG